MAHREQALIREIETAPLASSAREVYLDWLEERGDPRAAWVRADLAFARDGEGWVQLADLALVQDPTWLARVALRYDVVLYHWNSNALLEIIPPLRVLTHHGLRELRRVIEALPATLVQGTHGARAEAARRYASHAIRRPAERIADARIVPSARPPGPPDARTWQLGIHRGYRHALLKKIRADHPLVVALARLEQPPDGHGTLDAVLLQQLLLHATDRRYPLDVTR